MFYCYEYAMQQKKVKNNYSTVHNIGMIVHYMG